jgi:hypothetical protein
MAKEPKDPAFPHPALETGVPHYPTPKVPDFYTRDGHILLVEKISTDKGSYNPLPLDGSVTYSGKDARKWPSELYLVAERPTADGLFCYRFWANDRTMASQDPWNYGVSYSDNDPEYPVYSRQYIVPRDQYTPIAKGAIDPVFGGTAIVSQQQMQELDDENPLRSRYVQMVVQYESIPGPVVTGKQINQRGDVETVQVQTVAAGTDPDPDGYLTISSSIKPVDSIKSKREKTSVDKYSDLSGNSFQMGGGVGAAGGAEKKVTSQIVNPSTYITPTPTVSTLSYEEKPISTTKIQVVTESLVDTEFPKITSSDIDPVSHTGVYSSFSQIVAASSANKASASFGLVNEYADLDKWHSQLKQTDYRSLVGLTWTEYENESYSPPAVLYVYNSAWGSGNWTLANILSYQRPQPKTVTAKVTYAIRTAATTKDCFNPVTQTLITDLGTFTNVLHNAINYKANGVVIGAKQSYPVPPGFPATITHRFSSTRIPRMGGLYLERVVEIPFNQLYNTTSET